LVKQPAKKPKPLKRWQDDKRFVRWLIETEYAKSDNGKIQLNMSDGSYIYMWEAWRARGKL
jgi:hypothetical protein